MKALQRQRGISLSGLIMGCVILGVVALVGMKLFPLYNEKMKVDTAFAKVLNTAESARLSKGEIVQLILREFDVSDVDRFDTPSLSKIITVENMRNSPNKVLRMAYEIRGDLFGDLDVVLTYDRSGELRAASTD
ncbi:MAG: DUF4845 domain-containing protein [Gammaproteobacteria bacterium]|nr:DUF4845 domain-containing protein [Gammaproteobacteria bacterium]